MEFNDSYLEKNKERFQQEQGVFRKKAAIMDGNAAYRNTDRITEQDRLQMIKDVRKNLANGMQEENRVSLNDAVKIRNEHLAAYKDIITLMLEAREAGRAAEGAEYDRTYEELKDSGLNFDEVNNGLAARANEIRLARTGLLEADFAYVAPELDEQQNAAVEAFRAGLQKGQQSSEDYIGNDWLNENRTGRLNIGEENVETEDLKNHVTHREDIKEAKNNISAGKRKKAFYRYFREEREKWTEENTIHPDYDYGAHKKTRKKAGDRAKKALKTHGKLTAWIVQKKLGTEKKAAEKKQKKLIKEIEKKSADWNKIKKRYTTETFRKHYENFDRLARAYRSLSRGDKREKYLNKGDLRKNIFEYQGTFDEDSLNELLMNIPKDPYMSLEKLRFRNEKKEGVAVRAEDADALMKSHRRILMLSDSYDEYGLQTRYKMYYEDGKEMQYKARRQFDGADRTALVVRDWDEPETENEEPEKKEVNISAERNNKAEVLFEDDARGLNGELINSEDSVEIHTLFKTKSWEPKSLNGIFLNGMFIPAAINEKAPQSGYKTREGLSIKSLAETERLRRAVLRSSFFNHVNAKTVQFYMGHDMEQRNNINVLRNAIRFSLPEGYNGDDLSNGVGSVLEERLLKVVNKEELNDDEKDIRLSPTLLTKVIFDRIRLDLKEGRDIDKIVPGKGEKPDNNNTLKSYRFLIKHKKVDMDATEPEVDDLVLLDVAKLLLHEENERCWGVARKICENLLERRFAFRLKEMRRQSGEDDGMVSRMELLDEIEHKRSHLIFNPREQTVKPKRLQVWEEDVRSRRGTKAGFRRGLIDGSFGCFISNTFDMVLKAGYGATGEMLDPVLTAVNQYLFLLKRYPGFLDGAKTAHLVADNVVKGQEMNQLPFMGEDGQLIMKDQLKFEADAGKIALGYGIGNMGGGMLIGYLMPLFNKLTEKIKKDKIKKKAKNNSARAQDIEEIRKQLALLAQALPAAPVEGNEGDLNIQGSLKIRDRYSAPDQIVGLVSGLLALTGSIYTMAEMTSESPDMLGIKSAGTVTDAIGILCDMLKIVQNGLTRRSVNGFLGEINDVRTAVDNPDPALTEEEKHDNKKTVKRFDEKKQLDLYLGFVKSNASRQIIDRSFSSVKRGVNIFFSWFTSGNPTDPFCMTMKAVAAGINTGFDLVQGAIHKAKDRHERRRLLRGALDDKDKGMDGKELSKYSKKALDHVLKRETGIKSSSYLLDLTRLTTAIDTQEMFRSASEGDDAVNKKLATKIAGVLFSKSYKVSKNADKEKRKEQRKKNKKEKNVFTDKEIARIRTDQLINRTGFRGNRIMLFRNSLAG